MQSKCGNIVIVGASSGLGRSVATYYADRGWKVGVCARREEALKEFADQYDGNVSWRVLDVTAKDSGERFTDFIRTLGGVDIVLYAAGCGWNNPSLETERDEKTVGTNVDGFTRIMNAAFEWFAANGAVNFKRPQLCAITSIAGTKGLGVSTTYSASKGYENIYIEALAQLATIRNVKIDFTDIRPGFTDTDLLAGSDHKYPLLMSVPYASKRIVRALVKRKKVAYIDWRWHIVVALWRLIPRCLWVKLKITN